MKIFTIILTTLLLISIGFNSNSQVKKVFLEEMSTTLCSFCPYKSIDLSRYVLAHPNAIAVTHHAGFGQDAMTCQPALDFAQAFSPFHFPSMTIDRKKFDSVPNYYTKYVGVSMMAFKWEDSATSILTNITAKAVVTITKSWDPAIRKVSGNVSVSFISKPDSGDLRINLYIVEDSVVGDTGSYKYDQKNNHISDNNYPELFGKTVIQYYPHRNVVRAAPLGSWGISGIIPAKPALSTNYSAPFNYTIPASYDTNYGHPVQLKNIKLIGFVSYYNSNTWKRQVLNVEETNLPLGTSVNENIPTSDFTVFPNPATDFTNVEFTLLKESKVNISLYNVNGQIVATYLQKELTTGSYSLAIKLDNIKNGNYIMKIQTNDFNLQRKLIVIH